MSKCFASSMCIGKFDGFHRGHQKIIEYTKQMAKENGLESVLYTFLFENDSSEIDSLEEKRVLMSRMNLDHIVEQPFTEGFRTMEPEAFIRDVLVAKYGVRYLVVGDDFTFGLDRKGTPETLKRYAEQYGYQVKVFEKMLFQGKAISSTRIRAAIAEGKMRDAYEMLGRNYRFESNVVYGNQLGKKMLDMPTANQIPQVEKILPPKGVYASRVKVFGRWYDGVSNIGYKPTIPGENQMGVETYIYDFEQNIYGATIIVDLLWFIRPEQKFADLDTLKHQMAKDKIEAKKVLASLR